MCEVACEDVEDGEVVLGLFPASSWLKELGVEVETGSAEWRAARMKVGSNIVEIDAFEGLFDVQFPGTSVRVGSVPVKEPVSGVAVLLNLGDEASCSDGMAASAGDEQSVPALNGNSVKQGGGGLSAEMMAKDFRGQVGLAEPCVNTGIRGGIKEVPCFGF